MEGIIIAFDDCSISIDLKGRLGFLKIPKRMLITDYELKVGQEIGFNLSFPEVLSGIPNDKYVSNLEKRNDNKEVLS